MAVVNIVAGALGREAKCLTKRGKELENLKRLKLPR